MSHQPAHPPCGANRRLHQRQSASTRLTPLAVLSPGCLLPRADAASTAPARFRPLRRCNRAIDLRPFDRYTLPSVPGDAPPGTPRHAATGPSAGRTVLAAGTSLVAAAVDPTHPVLTRWRGATGSLAPARGQYAEDMLLSRDLQFAHRDLQFDESVAMER